VERRSTWRCVRGSIGAAEAAEQVRPGASSEREVDLFALSSHRVAARGDHR
jgi:hypothetical protein